MEWLVPHKPSHQLCNRKKSMALRAGQGRRAAQLGRREEGSAHVALRLCPAPPNRSASEAQHRELVWAGTTAPLHRGGRDQRWGGGSTGNLRTGASGRRDPRLSPRWHPVNPRRRAGCACSGRDLRGLGLSSCHRIES